MIPWNLLFLPLLGGFIFIKFCHFYRIQFQRFESYRLLFEAGVWGVLVAILGRLSAMALHPGLHLLTSYPLIAWAAEVYRSAAPFQYFGSAILAFAWGPVLAYFINRSIDEVAAKDIAIDQTGDQLLSLLMDSIDQQAPVLVSLNSRKVYVGYVWESPNLKTEMAYIVVMPVMSGYRNSDTYVVVFTTDYMPLWEEDGPPESLTKVIPVSSIASAGRFDLDMYEKHFKAKPVASGA